MLVCAMRFSSRSIASCFLMNSLRESQSCVWYRVLVDSTTVPLSVRTELTPMTSIWSFSAFLTASCWRLISSTFESYSVVRRWISAAILRYTRASLSMGTATSAGSSFEEGDSSSSTSLIAFSIGFVLSRV